MTKTKTYIISIISFLLFFISCKKYPENTLWFKDVNNIPFFIGQKLVQYNVNGVDSLEFLNNYFGKSVVDKNINKCLFSNNSFNHTNKQSVFLTPEFEEIDIGYTFSKNKKNIHFVFGTNLKHDTSFFRRNLFIDSGAWQIIKMSEDGARKIKRKINNNTYELHFIQE